VNPEAGGPATVPALLVLLAGGWASQVRELMPTPAIFHEPPQHHHTQDHRHDHRDMVACSLTPTCCMQTATWKPSRP
jgi:hypothetical protein